MFLNKTVQNINRIREVIKVLLQYGFEDIVVSTQLRRFIPRQSQLNWTRADKSIFEYTRWERLRMVMEELGPTFIKLGQAISSRPELIPDQLVVEFEKLHDKVPPFSGKIAKEIIERETGKPTEAIFTYFDEVPVGSASIGQVHRAKLLNGQDVVVKVRRPGVRRKAMTDLVLLRELVKLLDNFLHKNGILNPLDIVDAFEKTLTNELDYSIEAGNLTAFNHLYDKEKEFYVPNIYREYCSSRVLVCEFISGCKITDVKQIRAWGLPPEQIAEKGMRIYLAQIFEHGFFHADPHPGNVLIKPDGRIALIDYGMIGKLNKQNKFALAGFFTSMAAQDGKGMAVNLRRLAVESNIEDIKPLENDLNDLIEDFLLFEYADNHMADIVARVQSVIYRYNIKIPGSIYLILRAFVILEGIGQVMHPEIRVLDFLKPYGRALLREQLSPKNLGLEAYYTGTQLSSFIYNFPVELRSIMKKMRNGNLSVQIELQNVELYFRKLDYAANKIAIALIISAFIIGSSIAMLAGNSEVFLFGLPLFSFIGLGIAAILSIALVYYVLKKKP